MARDRVIGKRHLPLPKGPYTVGCTDIMTGCTKRGCFLRLYYPCSDIGVMTHQDQWPLWSINKHYIDGYAIFSPFPHFIARRVFEKICDNVYIPAILDSPPLCTEKRFPVIIFSHGLAACRGTYSAILTELASQGYIVGAVEHRDNSACYTYYMKNSRMSKCGPNPGSDISKLDDDVLDKEEDFSDFERYRRASLERKRHGKNVIVKEGVPFKIKTLSRTKAPYRNTQVRRRTEECSKALDLLYDLNDGLEVRNMLETKCDLKRFQGIMDLDRVAIGGHSFGGATVLMSLAADSRFKIGLALDPWAIPIECEENLPNLVSQPVIFINSSRFQTERDKRYFLKFEREDVDRKFVSIRGSTHYSQCDIPFMVPIGLNIVIGGPIQGSRAIHLSILNRLLILFLARHFGIAINPLHKDYVIEKSSHIKEGIATRRMYHLL